MSLAIDLKPLKPNPAPVYPFTAIAGQEKMKLGLLLTLIHPRIGGLLIRGRRGTAKSTAVRGLIHLLYFHRYGAQPPGLRLRPGYRPESGGELPHLGGSPQKQD